MAWKMVITWLSQYMQKGKIQHSFQQDTKLIYKTSRFPLYHGKHNEKESMETILSTTYIHTYIYAYINNDNFKETWEKNLTKEVKNLYNENLKTFKKKLNKSCPGSWTERISLVEIAILPKSIHKCNTFSI